MGLKKALFNIKGMTRDLAASKFSPEFAYENKNMRLVATDHNTSNILTNERGNLKVSSGIFSGGISGTPVGQAILNDNLILFTTGGAPTPAYVISVHSRLANYQSFKRYSTFTDAMNDINGTAFTLSYSVGNNNYFYGSAGEYVGYTDTDSKRKILSPQYGGIPVLVMNVNSDSDDLYYVTGYVGHPEAPYFEGNTVYFQISTDADTDTTDKIYKMSFNSGGTLTGEVLYSGTLGFSPSHPIETLTVFENEKIQKVYWTDGINQPRVINIAAENPNWGTNSFNFVRNVMYNGNITITKNQISFGSFAPGVIQYCFTYFDLYGTETNIFYTSPLYYVSPSTRGGNPEETVSCSFTINVPTYDTSFDYLRIYSILRTSINATPQVRKVVDISLKGASGAIKYVDTGVNGETLDPTSLLFIGGEPIFAGTMAQKDNTLFLGDITIDREPLSTTVKSEARNLSPYVSAKTISLPDDANVGNYSYTSQLDKNNSQITYFRRGETYRLGFQAQHYTGKWSDVVFIKDYKVTDPITTSTGSVSVNDIRVVLNATIINRLTLDGYVKVRPMVVFPDANDRTIICEGVCCPTVYNVEDRYTNSPYIQASWFFRPNAINTSSEVISNGAAKLGKWAEFRHNYPIPSNKASNAEIQCVVAPPSTPTLQDTHNGYTEPDTADIWVSYNKECYYIDQSIFTFHSPDIEFDDTLEIFDIANQGGSDKIGFRIIGYVPIHASYSDVDIEASTPSNYSKGKVNDVYQFKSSIAPGFIKTQVTISTDNPSYGWRSLLSGPLWYDEFPDTITENYYGNFPVGFIIYPWHKSGALNGAKSDAANSILKHKTMSIFRFSRNSQMLTSANIWDKAITGAVKFDSDELSMIKIPGQGSMSITYYGNIDKILTSHLRPKGKIAIRDYDASSVTSSSATEEQLISSLPGAYPILVVKGHTGSSDSAYLQNPGAYNHDDEARERFNVRAIMNPTVIFNNEYCYLDTIAESEETFYYKRYIFNDTPTTSNDPVSIKYKSTPHLVVALKNSSNNQVILPKNTGGATASATYSSGHRPFWDSTITGVSQDTISVNISTTGFLWLGELYRKDIDSATRFGGTSDEAIENNRWVVAGEPVSLSAAVPALLFTQGDTYYQRYDCLKTYPFTNEDANSVSDTLSFMCETRVNIDGRYDRNRGQLSTLYVTRANQNLVNMAYSQQNNYFVYRGFNQNKVNTTVFPNTITWSKTKSMGEEVDTWTNITLASTLDVDGDKGRVRALRRYNNDILCFQDRGISQILYNENVQIASATGVPIEIANSGKVSGKRYITNHIGCTNKWSICSTPNGMYFVDSLSSDIYLFNNQFNSLSDTLGFHSWTVNNLSSTSPWNPYDFNGCITYYDKITGDVMFITADTCLTFSEPIGHFSSFYDYGFTPFFATLKSRGIAFHQDFSNDKYYPYLHREGDYNNFFGVYKPFWTTVVVNPDPTEDKVFNNLEYRGDTFQHNNLTGLWDYKYDNTFDYLETWTEYQKGTANLTEIQDKPANLKKKFRVWRANIPRNTTNQGGDSTHRYTRDRMRNPWLYLKLAKTTSNNYRTELHDLVVDYFE